MCISDITIKCIIAILLVDCSNHPIYTAALFLYPLNTLENQRFYVFREYRKKSVAQKGLIYIFKSNSKLFKIFDLGIRLRKSIIERFNKISLSAIS